MLDVLQHSPLHFVLSQVRARRQRQVDIEHTAEDLLVRLGSGQRAWHEARRLRRWATTKASIRHWHEVMAAITILAGYKPELPPIDFDA